MVSSAFGSFSLLGPRTKNSSKFIPWFDRLKGGNECTVEIFGADLTPEPNDFDYFSKPDCYVKVRHHNCERDTACEDNTYQPRFMFSTRMPLRTKNGKGKGFTFSVFEHNAMTEDHIVGRAHITAEKAERIMRNEDKLVLSIGEGIGHIQIRIKRLAPFLGPRSIVGINDNLSIKPDKKVSGRKKKKKKKRPTSTTSLPQSTTSLPQSSLNDDGSILTGYMIDGDTNSIGQESCGASLLVGSIHDDEISFG